MVAITFVLLNRKNESVIYSLNQPTEGQNLTLRLEDNRQQPLKFKSGTGDVSADNYHFALCFQAGLLAPSNLQLENNAEWKIFGPVPDTDDNSDRYYFLYIGGGELSLSSSPLLLKLAGVAVEDGMITQYIRIMLRFNPNGNSLFSREEETVPQKPIQYLLAVLEDSPYQLDDIGQAREDFRAAWELLEVQDNALDFFVEDTSGETQEAALEAFKKAPGSQKFATIIEKAASKSWVKNELGPIVDEAVEEVEDEMKMLRNRTIMPLIGHIKEGWNFIPPADTGISITVQILPNVDFFSLDNLKKKYIVKARQRSEIIFFCPKFDVTIDTIGINGANDGVTWTVHKEQTELGLGRIENNSSDTEEISKDRILEIGLTLKPKPGTPLDMANLVLIFTNFAIVKSDKSEETVSGFDLHIPIYIGPLRVSPGLVEVGNDATEDGAANLHVNGNVEIDTVTPIDSESPTLDQEGSNNNHYSSGDLWQSFTVGAGGSHSGIVFLARVEIYIYNKCEGEFSIYAGRGTSGQKLYSQLYQKDARQWLTVDFNSMIPVLAGQEYTIHATNVSWGFNRYEGGYLHGESSVDQGENFIFKTYIVNSILEKTLVVSNGKVGIGTNAPSEKLEVNGNIGLPKDKKLVFLKDADENSTSRTHAYISGSDGNGGLKLTDIRSGTKSEIVIENGVQFYAGESSALNFRDNKSDYERMRIAPNGNVGIGTSTPGGKLTIEDNTRKSLVIKTSDNAVSTGMAFQNSGGYYSWNIFRESAVIADSEANDAYADLVIAGGIHKVNIEDLDERIRITKNGNVGIGEENPTVAKLHVEGYVNTLVEGTKNIRDYSAYFSHHIVSKGHHDHSDERIKEVIGVSNPQQDLRTLMNIEVTDYQMKDPQKDQSLYKKVIGQQVEKVFPQAVSHITSAIPDIQQMAEAQDGWVLLPKMLQVGERVKLIFGEQQGGYEVKEINAQGFRVDLPSNTTQVFVYGREVNDFRLVDYTAISMLNVAATQAIAQRMEAMEEKIRQLEEKLANTGNDRSEELKNGSSTTP